MFPQLREKNIPALNGIRAVAVALVMLFHFGFKGIPGGHGVLMFFVLSGFLITWLLLLEQEEKGSISLRAFYVRRALRILPAAYAFLLVGLGLLLVTHRQVVWTHVACVVAYVANYFTALHHEDAGNGLFRHLWSLAIEEQFYLLWPFVFMRLSRDPARMPKVLGIAIVGIWLYRPVAALSGAST